MLLEGVVDPHVEFQPGSFQAVGGAPMGCANEAVASAVPPVESSTVRSGTRPWQAKALAWSTNDRVEPAAGALVGGRGVGEAVAQHHGNRAPGRARSPASPAARGPPRRASSSASGAHLAVVRAQQHGTHLLADGGAARFAQAQHLAAVTLRSASARKRIWVVLPAPSPPSKVMNTPASSVGRSGCTMSARPSLKPRRSHCPQRRCPRTRGNRRPLCAATPRFPGRRKQ